MKIIGFAILVMVLPALAFAGDSSDILNSPLVVFVGDQVGLDELPDQCAGERESVGDDGLETICVQVNAVYRARYRLREPIRGIPPATEISFLVSGHYGPPEFTQAKTALLFVHMTGDENYVSTGFAVFPTSDGKWAMCGSPYSNDTPAAEQRVLPISFAEGVFFGDASTLSTAGFREQFGTEDYVLVKSQVNCRRGVYVQDLVDWGERELRQQRHRSTEPPQASADAPKVE